MGLVLWATLNGRALGDGGPILSAVGGEIVMGELGQFEASTVTLAAGVADDAGVTTAERAILAMAPYTLIEVVEEGLGTIGWGYVLNPAQAITDRGEDTITLKLEPLTTELTWRRTGRDWQAENRLSVVAARLGALVPGWTGTFDGAGTAADIVVLATLNNPTVLAGFLATMQQFAQYARLGVDATGAPTRTLEGGQFGAASGVTFQDAKGGDPDLLATNTAIRLVRTLDRAPNNVEDLCNVTVPFGGGQDDASLVDLERLWRIINDPTDPGYNRYGTDAASLAATGQPSLFPEYDHANHPISDPENPPTGAATYAFFDTTGAPLIGAWNVAVVGNPDGTRRFAAVDATGALVPGVVPQLLQGAIGTRRATLKGRWDYMVYDRASYATYGFKYTTDYIDSTLTYPSNAVADQELTERALYQSAAAFFLRYAHPHQTIAVTTNTANTRPPRPGDLVTFDYQRQARTADGTLVAVDERGTYRVMKAVRSFPTDGGAEYDTFTLSNLGRFDADDSAWQDDTRGTIVALQRNQGTGLAVYTRDFAGNIDASNPITLDVYVPKQHFRWHEFRVQCDWFPFRGTATTTGTSAATITIPVPQRQIFIPAQTVTLVLAGHSHAVNLTTTDSGGPGDITMRAALHVVPGKGGGHALYQAAAATSGWLEADGGYTEDVNVPMSQLTSSQFAHRHTIDGSTQTGGGGSATTQLSGASTTIPATTATTPLPQHTHDVEKRIPVGQPSPASVALSVAGQALSSGATATGTRDASGAFTTAFVAADLSAELNTYSAPGGIVALRFDAGTSAGNPFGVGWLQISITGVEELGGLVSNVSVQ